MIAIQKTLSIPPTMKRIMSVKEKTNSDENEPIPYQNWTSLVSNKSGTIIYKQKSISYNSNTGSLHNNSHITSDLEEK